MGIIIKQSIKGSIWSYIGVIIGFVTTSYLYPNYLTTDIVGLFGLLISYSTLFGQFSLLGMQGVTARLFPHFRDKETGHHGFLTVSLIFFALGLILFLTFFFLFSPWLIKSNIESSKLFADYVYLLVPLSICTMIFVQLDTYNKVLYDSFSGIFLQEFLQRFLLFGITVAFALGWLTLAQLIFSFAAIVCVKAIALTAILSARGEIRFTLDRDFLTPKFRREIIDVAVFSIITGLGSMIVFNIDKIVINQMLDLSNTGVYTIAFYFGTLVIIPSRPLLKISGTLIADAWANNDRQKIKEIYYKSCINQFIIGGFLFLGIWANIGNILDILGPDYAESKWVIFFIGIGYLFDMMTGANGHVLSYSAKYRAAMYFLLFLLLFVIVLLYLLIPIGGIVGAAIAICGALFLYNLMRYFYLLKQFQLQPFNLYFVAVAAFYVGLYFVVSLIPQFSLIIDIIIRGAIISLVSFVFLAVVPASPDIQSIIRAQVQRIKSSINKK
ncbi:lipopolysaccharide biosynthesis protein [Mangrovibacterium diazotrophicum]|uniref:O-antigen/teichoic acid export membrane protein n=1 Tax=Mangrovibacterium diazotrophicum TaxID=1261403 RepID=A0A419WAW1_9BACT|nr:polysaccharide biosynthesis C-terminal domain-containing protein [Mangrovibacterium diazotrophicum]RKD92583.1 O-antigen/teichoic acid export membrane protein [Mangrovibacterium diazotrophicum]